MRARASQVRLVVVLGAGGSRIAPGLARRLGVPFLERTPVPELLPDEARRRELEQEVREFAASGRGVILGRGAAIGLDDCFEIIADAARRKARMGSGRSGWSSHGRRASVTPAWKGASKGS